MIYYWVLLPRVNRACHVKLFSASFSYLETFILRTLLHMRIDDSWDPRRPYYDVLSIGKRKALYQGASNDLLMAGKRSRRHVGQEHQTFFLYRYKKSNTSPKSPTKQCKSPTKQHTERLFCAPSKQHKERLLRGGLSNEGCSM